MTTANEGIRVYVADDHAIVREGLKYFLEAFDDLVHVGEAANGLRAVEGCMQLKPHVVLMDLFMPHMNGIEAVRNIRRECPETNVVMLTSSEGCEHIFDAFRAGAVNYVLKSISIHTLANVIRAARDGKFLITDETTQILISAVRQSNRAQHNLSEREREVLALMIKGYHNVEIAEHLFISVSTVKNHISSIFSKMSVSSRSEAVARTVHEGILDDTQPAKRM